MGIQMLNKPAVRPVSVHIARKLSEFKREERGAVTIFVMMLFMIMLMFGGIAVDVMRFEMRRVALQETLDRATLAAANLVLPPSMDPKAVAENWYTTAGLGDEFTVDFSTPTVTGVADSSSRKVTATAKVRSYNHFMGMMDVHYLEAITASAAEQGATKVEVMLVLDVTGSMSETITGGSTKIAALRTAAANFVNILDASDPKNLISIGLVPYASQVNIPVPLRDQFAVTNLSSWDNVPAAGVPGINCIEIPTSTYATTGLSTTTPMAMHAVADARSSSTSATALNWTSPTGTSGLPNAGAVACSKGADTAGTANLVQLPTTLPTPLTNQISQLQPRGNTAIAVGMRWGVALMDETAKPIYTNLLSETAMAGRPALNDDLSTRKIIVLMTDGNHVINKHIRDAYKTGLAPVWRGTDGNFAIRFWDAGGILNGGLRPHQNAAVNYCSGWPLAVDREYFIPHLKRNSVKKKVAPTEPEGVGTGTSVGGACDPRAWKTAPSWTNSGTVTQLDWSEVWRYVKLDWVVRQLYYRSDVGGTKPYATVHGTFATDYLTSVANMDALLTTTCSEARTDGKMEIFSIAFGDNISETVLSNCATPGGAHFFHPTDPASLNAVFEQIAVLISDLRLTQ
jgi:hypothetical protein